MASDNNENLGIVDTAFTFKTNAKLWYADPAQGIVKPIYQLPGLAHNVSVHEKGNIALLSYNLARDNTQLLLIDLETEKSTLIDKTHLCTSKITIYKD